MKNCLSYLTTDLCAKPEPIWNMDIKAKFCKSHQLLFQKIIIIQLIFLLKLW